MSVSDASLAPALERPSARPLLPWVALVLGIVLLLAVAGPAAIGAFSEDPLARSAAATSAFEARTGIRVLRVGASGGGGLIDVRYQVLDPTKAAAALDESVHPTIVDDATGLELTQPWMGHAGHPGLKRAVTYFVLLENPTHVIAPGSAVTVVVGDARLEHVRVG